jgi:CRISPR/Cas system CSM-associated protein Csm5 (group 7 of RAMP superfamily)
MDTNGRLELLSYQGGTPLFLKDKILPKSKVQPFNALQHTLQNNELSVLFFSTKNIEIIENAIKAGVYHMSSKRHVIDTQDKDQLYVIMRATFLNYSLNQPEEITKQIEVLNARVVSYCVPKIYGEIQGYLQYKKDISTLAVPLSNPIYYHKDTTVEFKQFF